MIFRGDAPCSPAFSRLRLGPQRHSRGTIPRTSPRRRIGSAAAAALAVTVLAAGCHPPGASGAGGLGSGKLSQITVAAIPGVTDVPLYLAATGGQFRRAGLQVTIKDFKSVGGELKALRQGTVQVATGDYTDFFFAESNNPNLLMITDGYDGAPNAMEVLSLPGSRITTAQDLTGKTIGTAEPDGIPYNSSVPYNLPTLATQSVLQNDGVNLTTLRWQPMPAQNLVQALRSHQVDAILATEPYIFQAESQAGAIEVLDSLSGGTANLPVSGYFTTTSLAAKDGPALRAFRSALSQAQGEAAGGGQVQSVLAHYGGLTPETAAMITVGQYPTSANAASVQRVADLMAAFGMLSGPISVQDMLFR